MPDGIVQRWRGCWWGITTAIVLVLAAPRPAFAEPSLALTEVRLIKAPPTLRKQIEQAMLASLLTLGYRVVGPDKVRENPKYQPSCTGGPCLVSVGRVLKVDRVLHCAIAAHGTSNYDINLTLYETASGGVLAQVQSQCNVCTYADVTKRSVAATQRIVKRGQAAVASKAWLDVRSDPSGAEVRVDDVVVGRTPLKRLMAPGRHRLTVTRAGLSAQRSVELSAGRTSKLALKLKLGLKPRPPKKRQRLESWWIGWLGVGLGAAGATAGAVLAGLASKCEGDCEHGRRTAGIALLGSGAALVAAGVFALVVDSWQRRAGPARRPRQRAQRRVVFGIDPVRRSVGLQIRY